jgi:septum formation inhibitor MinC
MKVRQKNIRAFLFTLEEGDEAAMLAYINDNTALLNRFTIIIEGMVSNQSVTQIKEQGYSVIVKDLLNEKEELLEEKVIKTPKERSTEVEKKEINEADEELEKGALISYNSPIRSGNSIDIKEDILLFKPINSGAKVMTSGNVVVVGMLNGILEASGEYVLIHHMGTGQLFFHSEHVPLQSMQKKLIKVSQKSGELQIEEL